MGVSLAAGIQDVFVPWAPWDSPGEEPIALDTHHSAINLIGKERIERPGLERNLHRFAKLSTAALEFIDRAVQRVQIELAQVAFPPQCGQILANVRTVAGEIIGNKICVRKPQCEGPQ